MGTINLQKEKVNRLCKYKKAKFNLVEFQLQRYSAFNLMIIQPLLPLSVN